MITAKTSSPISVARLAGALALSVAIVMRAWRSALGPGLSRFSRSVFISAALVVLLVLAFALYIRSDKHVERAHELRYRSYLLADELRQSGDDLTRMARTYVVTGEPAFKQHFQDILDIRDGKKARPENYSRPYWDLVLADGPAPRRSSGPAIPLLELMRQAGFTSLEFSKLAEAKANSDALTLPEFEAMKLVESTGPDAEANRAKARRMMYDDKYHQAKVAVMGPIHDFFVLVDQRTFAAVQTAEIHAMALRYVFAALGLGLLFMLWRAYAALRDTLGASVEEIYAHIAKLGSGDFSAAMPVKAGLENSVLGWLSATQAKLNDQERERQRAEAAWRAEITERKQAEEELARRAEELAQFNAAAVGRELRMIELKQQVNDLSRQLGQPPPYSMEFLGGPSQTTAPGFESEITRSLIPPSTHPGGAA